MPYCIDCETRRRREARERIAEDPARQAAQREATRLRMVASRARARGQAKPSPLIQVQRKPAPKPVAEEPMTAAAWIALFE